jgi:23S rRNA (uracil1939-C5)-methyltransferase
VSRAAGAPESGDVAALNHAGEGVVRAGKAAFVPGALPGERISFRRRKSHRHHDEADLLAVLQPSPARVMPPCAHFGVCGGCALQHLAVPAQLQLKEQQLREDLQRIGKVSAESWLAPITGPESGYRRRARLGARYVFKRERSLVGFRERQGRYVAAIDRCLVLAPPADDLITPLAELLTALSIREQLPQIELAVADNAVALVLRVLVPPSAADLALLAEFETVHGVQLYLQPGGLPTIRPLSADARALNYRLPEFDLTLQFEPSDFIQVNGAVNRALIGRVVELMELTPEARVLDLFCGLGNFSLPLARRAAEVVGVEGDAGLVARAAANAALNGMVNARFHTANLAEAPPQVATRQPAWLQGGYSHVLLDPPRVGAREMLESVAALRPRRIAYVACQTGSLARDLGVLVNEHGFRLLAAGVADMFPHTAHVESVAVLAPS